jgi:hypothetical protein
VYSYHDHAKVDFSKYFFQELDDGNDVDFFVLCRFCYSDFLAWIYGGEEGEYANIEQWDIPDDQRREGMKNMAQKALDMLTNSVRNRK